MNRITPCIGRLFPFDSESESFKTLRKIEIVSTLSSGKPIQKIKFFQCGQM